MCLHETRLLETLPLGGSTISETPDKTVALMTVALILNNQIQP